MFTYNVTFIIVTNILQPLLGHLQGILRAIIIIVIVYLAEF